MGRLPASLLGLAISLREGRGPCSAGDEPPSGAGLLLLLPRMPSLLMRRAEFVSLGILSPQLGQTCSLSPRSFGTHARQSWQNWVVPHGSTKTVCFPSWAALKTALLANLPQDASEMDFASLWFLSIPETFSFSRTRTSLSLKIRWTSLFWKSSLWRLT